MQYLLDVILNFDYTMRKKKKKKRKSEKANVFPLDIL